MPPPPTVRAANCCCKAATCWGVEMSPDWRRPVRASGLTAMMEPGTTEFVVLVMALEPDPCTPEVETATLLGAEVETVPWAVVETTPGWVPGVCCPASEAGGPSSTDMMSRK